jgi:hypothetical protein
MMKEIKMKASWLRYLGFLGLLGLLGLATGNVGFSGFFGFFGFFAYNRSVADERFDSNVNRSARNAFVVSLVVFAVAVVCAALIASAERVYAVAFAASFALQILIFAVSLAHFETRGDEM